MRSMKTSFLWSAVILLVITAIANADYQLIDLGTLGGAGSSSCAFSINDSCQIVGSASYVSSTSGYATLFDSTGGKANINIAPIISGSRQLGGAYSINNNGQIVGYAGSSPSSISAYLFDSTGGGGGTNLGNLPGLTSGMARAINDNGSIVGNLMGPINSIPNNAVRFSPSPKANLGSLGDSSYSIAYSINNSGKIAGVAATLHTGDHACFFNSSGGGANLDLGTIAGNVGSGAYSINNLDQIVGYAMNSNASIYSAVRFDSTGGGANINIGALDDHYNQSVARSINDHGQIIGYAFSFNQTPFNSHAVLFDSRGQGNNTDLNALIAPSSWTLTHAYGINNNGWIVGDMINANGDVHAFLLTPEPMTLLLFALGGATILHKRRS